MARLPEVGGDKGNWGDILNDFLLQAHNADGSAKPDASAAGAVVVSNGNEVRPSGHTTVIWVDTRQNHSTRPVHMTTTDVWVVGQVNNPVPDASTYSIYGSNIPGGEWNYAHDGDPWIELAQGFTTFNSSDPTFGLGANPQIIGARLYFYVNESPPTQAVFRLYSPSQDLGGMPTQSKTVSLVGVTPGSWFEVYFDQPETIANDGDIWLVSYQFTDAGSQGYFIRGDYVNSGEDTVSTSGAYLKWVGANANPDKAAKYNQGGQVFDSATGHSYGLDIIMSKAV